MQLPGLDELESSVARATEELKRLKAENAGLNERLQVLGKEIDDLGALIDGIGPDRKIDSKTKKRMDQKLRSMTDHVA